MWNNKKLVIAAVLIAVPLGIAPSLVLYFDVTPKTVAILLGCSALLLFSRSNAENVQVLVSTPTGRCFALLLAAEWLSLAVSAAASNDPALAAFGGSWRQLGLLTYTAILLFVLFAAAWAASERGNILSALRAIASGGAAGSLYGIGQYFGYDPFLPAATYHAGEGPFTIVRPPGTLGHAGYFAAWLLTVVFCDLELARLETSRVRRRLALSAASLAAFAIVLSGSRAGIVGLILGAAYMGVRGHWAIRWRMVAGSAAVGILFVAFVASPGGARLRARVHWSLDDLRGGARLLLWRDSLRLAGSHPLLGVGPENFVREFPRSQSLELACAYPDFYHESPHNLFLDALVGQGALGLAVWIGLCLTGLYTARRQRVTLRAGMVGAIVCHQFTVLVPATALYLLFLVGLLAGEVPPAAVPAAVRRRTWNWTPVSAALALIFAIAAVRYAAADHARAVSAHAMENRDPWSAEKAYASSLRWEFPGGGWDLGYSRRMAALGSILPHGPAREAAWRDAVDAAERAAQTAEDRQNGAYNLAMLFAARNDTAGVERALRMAIAAAPAWFKPRWTLAQLLEMTGRHTEAREQAAAAIARDGGHNAEVTATWRRISQARTE